MRNKRDDNKNRIIAMVNVGQRSTEIARALGLSINSVSKWVNQWRRETPELFED